MCECVAEDRAGLKSTKRRDRVGGSLFFQAKSLNFVLETGH